MADICVIGLGHIGLPTAVMLATNGHSVVGVDIDPGVVAAVNAGSSPISEPGAAELVAQAVRSGSLTAQSSPQPAATFTIAVPTPVREDRSPDMRQVAAAAEAIAPLLKPGDLIIIESTVPPGATADTVAPILEKSGLKVGADLFLAHCPERVLPGNAIREIVENDRIIGGVSDESSRRAEALYRSFVTGRIHVTDATTAEVAKLSENAFRDVNVALANELARISEKSGVDANTVIDLANRHPRVNLLRPGPGVGGHCIPIDPWFLVAAAPSEARLIRAAREINDAQPALVADRVLHALRGAPRPRAAILGVAYKADVADARETPANDVIRLLEDAGVQVAVHDPCVRRYTRSLVPLTEALRGADIAVILTDHSAFRSIEPGLLGTLMRSHRIFDTRDMLDRAEWRRAGFSFMRLGDGRRDPAAS